MPGSAKINVTGGTVESYYSNAIREIGNDPSVTQLAELNVTGGEVLGASKNLGNVTNDMLVRDISVKNVSVSGGTFNHEVQSEYCADKFVPVNNNDGTYGVKVNDAYMWRNCWTRREHLLTPMTPLRTLSPLSLKMAQR